MDSTISNLLSLVNFFFLALALLAVYYYAFRLRMALRRTNELKAESDRYKALFNATSEGVAEIDLDGRFIIINQGGARIFGYEDPQELLASGARFQDFYVQPELWKTLLNRVLLTSGAVQQVAKIQTYHKGQLWIELTFHATRKKGEIDGVEGIFRDVTERLAMQQALKNYSENLEKKVEEKTTELVQLERHKLNLEKLAATGQLVAQLVHELRNPLSSIKMGLSTLKKRADLIEKDQRVLEILQTEVSRLERMLRELLNYAKPETLQFAPHQINDILEQTLEKLSDQLEASQCHIVREFTVKLPPVNLDRDRIGQVFTNVILNAHQAMEGPGQLVVRTALLPETGQVRIEISDQGKGIAQDQLNHIFEPFYSRREGGTGLGLTVVKTIVEAHSGEVAIRSKPGAGTTVCIDLPGEEEKLKIKDQRLKIKIKK